MESEDIKFVRDFIEQHGPDSAAIRAAFALLPENQQLRFHQVLARQVRNVSIEQEFRKEHRN